MKTNALLGLVLLVLAGCGEPFHLRGSVPTARLQQSVYLQGTILPSDFEVALKQGLIQAGATLQSDPKVAQVHLTISRFDEKRTVSGYSATRQVREFNHALDVSFWVNAEGIAPSEERSVHVERTQVYDSLRVLGSAEEEAAIKQELRREAVRLLLLRLKAAISTAQTTK